MADTTSRDKAIDDKAQALCATKHSGWNIGAARAFAATLPATPASKACEGLTSNGWPVTERAGARISLEMACDVGGAYRFAKASRID